ncbi:MAG: preprotein translocase subunit SecG [Planctomycetes bacterium]|nr:preprotein translocase subunit SecG [Planctomycetota bacterium]
MEAVLQILLWILFFASGVVMSVVILLQQGGGGGLAEAFGGVGAETFGVRASGATKFTFGAAAVFLTCAVLLHATW